MHAILGTWQYLVSFSSYLTLTNVVTLTQGHRIWHHSIDCIRVCHCQPMVVSCTISEIKPDTGRKPVANIFAQLFSQPSQILDYHSHDVKWMNSSVYARVETVCLGGGALLCRRGMKKSRFSSEGDPTNRQNTALVKYSRRGRRPILFPKYAMTNWGNNVGFTKRAILQYSQQGSLAACIAHSSGLGSGASV